MRSWRSARLDELRGRSWTRWPRRTVPLCEQVNDAVAPHRAHVIPVACGAAVTDVSVGHRPIPLDGRPLIGRASDISGYYEAVTHTGLALGPILVSALSAEILRDQSDTLVSGFHASQLR